MYKLACRDLGMDCNQVLTGNARDEVKEKAYAHARKVHAAELKSMNTPEKMSQMDKLMDSKIQSM
jgi:predicted small metal-binding protein